MIGIFKIPLNPNRCCYFVKRPFGNLLLFADELGADLSSLHPLISSCGGLAKIFLESTQGISEGHSLLFKKYGADVICNTQKHFFHPLVKVERLQDLSEPNIFFQLTGPLKIILLEQNKKKVMFVGNEAHLISGQIYCQKIDITQKVQELVRIHRVELVYFTHYEKESVIHINKNKSTILNKFLNLLSSNFSVLITMFL